MLNVIKNRLVSISDLKKAPMNLISEAKELNDAVYILSNNKNVGVVLDTETYELFVNEKELLKKDKEKLEEQLFYLQTELRLSKSSATLTDEEVRGDRILLDLDSVPDEWE